MTLLLDLGNSRLKWAVLGKGGRLGPAGAASHADVEEGDGLRPILALSPPPERALMATVSAPERAEAVARRLTRAWGLVPERVETGVEVHGVRNGYGEPLQLGVDRWLALVGARAQVAGAVCAVDVGTAITLDVMDEAGCHRGGRIMPGLGLMRSALHRGTEGVRPGGEGSHRAGLPLAVETAGGVRQGTLAAAVGFIETGFLDAERWLGRPLTGLITGGDAEVLLPCLRHGAWHHDPHLVLRGLARYTL